MLKFIKNRKKTPEADTRAESAGNNPQGIFAKGNALHRIGSIALLVTLVCVGLGFSYLLLVREPVLEKKQLDRVASSFAQQQATSLHLLFTRMVERIQGAAQTPLVLSALAGNSDQDIFLVEKTMLDFFPEVISLRVIPVGELGTADFTDGNRGLRNHIEVDMVRRASEGEKTQPLAYKFEDSWLTSITARVTHPRLTNRQAVIIVTLDNADISHQLNLLESGTGKFAVEQLYISSTGAKRTDIIAATGSAADGADTHYADIPDTPWRVAFSPSQTLQSSLDFSQLPLFAVLALIVGALFGAAFIILSRYPKALQAEVSKVISSADRKSQLALAIPELVDVAKQLRRATLRALRHSSAASTAPAEVSDTQPADSLQPDLTNPLFQSGTMLDQDDEVLDLDLAPGFNLQQASPPGGSGFPQNIFRAYDIRGNANTELTDELVSNIGKAIGSIAGEMNEQALIVGCDGRNSSPRIKSTLIRALMESGRDVIDIGLVPTPLLYFATRHLDYPSGVMVTGSHNPPDHNGLKIVLGQETIAAGGIQQIRDRVIQGNFDTGNGRMTREDVIPAYMEEVIQDIAIAVPLKVVIDAGNGATGEIAPLLFEELGCEVVPIHCQIDGNFSNRSPDTSNEDNLADLAQAVQDNDADFGVAFDGDGDRLAVVTSSGNIVRSDVLLMLYAQDVVSRNPGADVVFDVKCSRNLTDLITRHGGRPVLWKTGHAFMKEKMRTTGALLGGEFSGHIFFGERWFGFDDGMYAAGRLAEILSTHGESLDDSIAELPTSVNTPEIIIPIADNYKFELIEKILSSADFSSGKINTMDGIRVDFTNGWGLIRASNTGPALTARFEADTEENLEMIKEEFRAQIGLIDPEITLGF